MNRSNWKGSETKLAKLFPGGKRRTRVGGGTYAEVADDVIWLFKERRRSGKTPRIIKLAIEIPAGLVAKYIYPIYIESKKRARCELVSFFKTSEKKYFQCPEDRLALGIHVKHDPRLFVMVDERFFKELIEHWYYSKGLDVYVEDKGGKEEE